MFWIIAAELALGLTAGVATAALVYRKARARGQGQVLWSLPIGVIGILVARGHFLITSTSSEAVGWASLVALMLAGATSFSWYKNKWHSPRP